jgi:hypothetical protein
MCRARDKTGERHMSGDRQLPPGIGPDAPDVETDPGGAEARGLAMVDQAAGAILAGVERELPAWVVRQVTWLLDARGSDPQTRARAEADAEVAGRRAAARVVAELRRLFALDVEEQRATPLQIVRSAYREPTEILEAAGVPPVRRDEFEQRALPDDRYGLALRGLGDLGDDDLAPLLLAWGVGKATVVRARRARRA